MKEPCKDSDKFPVCLVNIGHFLLCAPAMPFCKARESGVCTALSFKMKMKDIAPLTRFG